MIFAIRSEDRFKVAIVTARDREDAKRIVQHEYPFGNPDKYVVEPIADESDQIFIRIAFKES